MEGVEVKMHVGFNLEVGGNTFPVKRVLKKLGYRWKPISNTWIKDYSGSINKYEYWVLEELQKLRDSGIRIAKITGWFGLETADPSVKQKIKSFEQS